MNLNLESSLFSTQYPLAVPREGGPLARVLRRGEGRHGHGTEAQGRAERPVLCRDRLADGDEFGRVGVHIPRGTKRPGTDYGRGQGSRINSVVVNGH